MLPVLLLLLLLVLLLLMLLLPPSLPLCVCVSMLARDGGRERARQTDRDKQRGKGIVDAAVVVVTSIL
jgi:hypothetical protein